MVSLLQNGFDRSLMHVVIVGNVLQRNEATMDDGMEKIQSRNAVCLVSRMYANLRRLPTSGGRTTARFRWLCWLLV